MLVMLSCGPSSNKIIQTVSSQADNVDFLCYYTVEEFINQSKLRTLAFDRLVITSRFMNKDEDMSLLCDYIRKESNSSEIVFILSKTQVNLEDMFKKYFDSPLYTAMYVDKPTTKCIEDAVKLPIVDVKARYYLLDKPSGDTSAEKNPKIGMFKGGKKNKKDKYKTDEKVSEDLKNTENSSSSVLNNTIESVNKIDSNLNINSGDSGVDAKFPVVENKINSEFNFDVPAVTGDNNLDSSGTSFVSEDLDLAIGDFGSQHSDSGFVGEDDISELERFSQSQQKHNTEESNVQAGFSHKEPEGRGGLDKVNIVTGLMGSGITAYVVNKATQESRKGKKVLIVDLDYNGNGILSFLNTVDFYKKGCNSGLKNKVVYSEDGIDILSNGYDTGVVEDIGSILKGVSSQYDVVFVDCPLECTNIIPDDVYCKCNIIVGCISDISKLIETSAKLCDRSSISLAKDIHISEDCMIANRNISKQDVDLVKSVTVFPNGCWLDNMGIKRGF